MYEAIRSKKIRESARGEDCQFLGPTCNYDSNTTVFAHVNDHVAGKGIGRKADDIFGFYGCSSCHQLYDSNGLGKERLESYMWRAVFRTQRILVKKGLLKIG